MKALILCAGKGTRLKELTKELSKVMIPLNGKPCLEYNIQLLKRYGIIDIAINTHYMADKIKDFFGDGSSFGVNLTYSYEQELMGTSGALNNFRDFFKDEDFFVIYGDTIHNTNLNEMVDFHYFHRGIATLALDNREQKGKGVVLLDGNRIVSFVEKPGEHILGGRINSGIYLVNPTIMEYIPPFNPSDFGREIFPRILRAGETIYGFETKSVIDIGTLDDLELARNQIGNYLPL